MEVLAKAGQAAGLTEDELKEVQEQMTHQTVKDRLRAYTDQAIQYGVSIITM